MKVINRIAALLVLCMVLASFSACSQEIPESTSESASETITEDLTESNSLFSQGLLAVPSNDSPRGKWGYINPQGEFVIGAQYDEAENFDSNGLAAVKINGKWGFINEAGEFAIDAQYDDVETFAENGLAAVKINDKWGFINEAGEFAIDAQYDSIGYSQDMTTTPIKYVNGFNQYGVARVCLDNKWGLINDHGEIILEIKYDSIHWAVYNGYSWLMSDDKCGFIGEKGDLVCEPIYDWNYCGTFGENGLAIVSYDGSSAGYINTSGELIGGMMFDSAHAFGSNGFAAVEIDDKWGFINESGELVIDAQYDAAKNFCSNGLAAVKTNDKWGFINEDGKLIINTKYQNTLDFDKNGYAIVTLDDKYGIINEQGILLGNKWFDAINTTGALNLVSHDGLFCAPDSLIPVKIEGQCGYINEKGEIVIEATYDYAGPFADNGLARVEINNKWGYINKKGETVIEIKYDLANDFCKNIAVIELDGKAGLIDEAGSTLFLSETSDYYDRRSFNHRSGIITLGELSFKKVDGNICRLSTSGDVFEEFYDDGMLIEINHSGNIRYFGIFDSSDHPIYEYFG